MGKRVVRQALDTGVFAQPWRGIVIRADEALDIRTRAAAALLAIGDDAALAGPTAVTLHSYTAAECHDVHVALPYSRSPRSRPGLVVHRKHLAPEDIVWMDGLPVLAHDLALADMLCDHDTWSAFASLDQALYGLDGTAAEVVRSGVRRRLDARSDPRGVAKAKMLTALATGKADSPPESFFRLIVVEAGLPIPEPQVEVRTIGGDLLFILDMAWESLRVALEYDGYVPHAERAACDAERDRELARRGWIVVHARSDDLRDPARVLTELRSAFRRRQR